MNSAVGSSDKPLPSRYAVILCGGSGTRLWPLFRSLRPKQLLCLNGANPAAADRNDGLPPLINIGFGEDVTIAELANLVKQVVGYQGGIVFDTGKPDGAPRKLLDIGRLAGLEAQGRPACRHRAGLPGFSWQF